VTKRYIIHLAAASLLTASLIAATVTATVAQDMEVDPIAGT
jgi:hypothetical protein